MTKDTKKVSKWHPDNVTWPGIPTHPSYLTRPGPDAAANISMEMGEGYSVVPAEAYRALYEQREKELAAARELADAVENEVFKHDGLPPRWGWMCEPPDADSLGDAAAQFREVDNG